MVQLTELGHLRREPHVSRNEYFVIMGIIKDVKAPHLKAFETIQPRLEKLKNALTLNIYRGITIWDIASQLNCKI
jgi:hypothetical protein